MSRSSLKAIQSAAGAAGSDPVYVDDVFSTHLYGGNGGSQSIDNGIKLGNSLTGGTATLFNWNDKMELSSGYQTESGVNSYTISFYVRCITGEQDMRMFSINAYSFAYLDSDRFQITINRHDGNGNAAALYYTCTGISDGRWHHILFSVHSNGNESCYFDDNAASLFAGDVYSSSNMAGVGAEASYGVDVGGLGINSPTATACFRGSLAHVYIKGGEYLDLSQSSNRRIFTNSDLTPVATSNLSARNPQIYLPLGDNRTTNLGTMNNFNEVGTPKPCTGVDEVGTGEGGLVWIKARDNTSGGATAHALIDTERGATKWLSTDSVSEQSTNANLLTAFNYDGFTVGTGGPYWTNDNGYKYASWTFRKQTGFFDVVTWDGNGTAGRAISHNLGSVPGMILVKSYDHPSGVGNTDWLVYHRQLNSGTNPHNYGMILTSSSTEGTQSWWNNTAPTSTTFTVNASQDINGSGGKYVAYLFAHDAQDFGTDSDEAIIKCGRYTNSGSAWSVNLGFEPQFVFSKLANGPGSWQLMDNMRGLDTIHAPRLLKAHSSNAENNAADFRITATGFEGTGAGDTGPYIYMAIRRPHKPASTLGKYKVFDQDYGTERNNTNDPVALTNFPVDLVIERHPGTTSNNYWFDRLRKYKYVLSDSSNAQADGSLSRWFDYSDGALSNFSGVDNYLFYSWRRAAGFFDVTTYTGTGNTLTVNHNLGVAPEMMLIKSTSGGYEWQIWTSPLGINSKFEFTNAAAGTGMWNNYTPTATNFQVIGNNNTSASGVTYVAYLFASVDGISKIGTYTGQGAGYSIDVNCGFTNGVRFLIIKRSDSTGDWYLFDAVRGIVAGSDPFFLLNSTASQTTGSDMIDQLSSGFTVTSYAGLTAGLNASGGTYVFYAIAK